MEIHKPHAAKSWHEFAIEIGTIVIGILIALAMEQAVDALHKRGEAQEATEAVRSEMQFSMDLIHNRNAAEKCIMARLGQIETLIAGAKSSKFRDAPVWIGTPPRWLMSSTRWDFTASSGRLSLLPSQDQENYADLHRRILDIDSDLLIEQTDWAQLRVFERDPHISPQEEATVSAALQDARYRNARIQFSIARLDELTERLNIQPHLASDPGTQSICMPFGTSPEEARKKVKGFELGYVPGSVK